MECALGQFPYECNSEDPAAIFWDLLHSIVNRDPPTLPPEGGFSPEIHALIAACLQKAPAERASAAHLLEAPFVCNAVEDVEVSAWFRERRQKGLQAEEEGKKKAGVDIRDQGL